MTGADLMGDHPTMPHTLRTLTAGAHGMTAPLADALAPPIHVSTTYLRDADNAYSSGRMYGRADNPSLQNVETLLARLEGASEAMLFGSGTAAATAVILSLPPTHIVAPTHMYFGLRTFLADLARYGHAVTFVAMEDSSQVRAAVIPGRTGLVWVETPSNPLWTVTDLAAVAEIAHGAGAIVCADCTAATPILMQPIRLGADVVVHSATKYLNGHSDVIAGVAMTACPGTLWPSLRRHRERFGTALGAFEAWLLLRGLRTLDLRVRAQSASALELARRLERHPAIEAVLYPGLASHPGHALAARQMSGGFGGMLSVVLVGGAAAAIDVASNVRLWRRATSFGGAESLIEHRASIEGFGSGCPDSLLRLSVGLEDVEELFADLCHALNLLL